MDKMDMHQHVLMKGQKASIVVGKSMITFHVEDAVQES